MIRDISVGRTPAVFGGNRLYALPALAAAFTQASLVRFVDLNPVLAMLFSMCGGGGFLPCWLIGVCGNCRWWVSSVPLPSVSGCCGVAKPARTCVKTRLKQPALKSLLTPSNCP